MFQLKQDLDHGQLFMVYTIVDVIEYFVRVIWPGVSSLCSIFRAVVDWRNCTYAFLDKAHFIYKCETHWCRMLITRDSMTSTIL